jgi:hypothetical protein
VDTASNTAIGVPLLSYPDFADNAKTVPGNETGFEITIPRDLGDACSTPGACVVQHYWNAAAIDQTYESCVDFVVGGSGSGAGSASAVVLSMAASSSGFRVSTAFAIATNTVSSKSTVPTTLQPVVSSIASTSTEAAAVVTSKPAEEEETC